MKADRPVKKNPEKQLVSLVVTDVSTTHAEVIFMSSLSFFFPSLWHPLYQKDNRIQGRRS